MVRHALVVLAAAWFMLSLSGTPKCLAADKDVKKQEAPDAAAQAKAEKVIKDTFKAEFAKRRPADLLSLAKTLLQLGLDTKDEPSARFVALREARDLAARGGDIALSLKVIEKMDELYAVDALEMRIDALDLAVQATTSPDGTKAIVEKVLAFADEFVAGDKYDAALRLLTVGEKAAVKTRSTALLNNMQARAKEVEGLRKDYEVIQKAQKTLKAKPDDPESNLVMGKRMCFVKGNWNDGLPLLARGSDATLKELAKKDSAVPTEALKQVELGDGWWDLAMADNGSARAQLQQRAQLWYKEALPKLTGVTKAKVEKRVAEPAPTERFLVIPIEKAATADTTQPLYGTPAEELIFPSWGKQKYERIPFNVPEPKDGKYNAIVLRAGWIGKYPKEASVSCGVACKAIHLLSGVSGGGWYPGKKDKSGVAMVVRLHYDDGTTEDHEFLDGVHFANFRSVIDVPGSKLAFKLKAKRNIPPGDTNQVRYLAITPKRPTVKIDTIDFLKGEKGDDTSPIVMAITVEKP